jgi:hypothetical protein
MTRFILSGARTKPSMQKGPDIVVMGITQIPGQYHENVDVFFIYHPREQKMFTVTVSTLDGGYPLPLDSVFYGICNTNIDSRTDFRTRARDMVEGLNKRQKKFHLIPWYNFNSMWQHWHDAKRLILSHANREYVKNLFFSLFLTAA